MESAWRVFIAIELPIAWKQMLHNQVDAYARSSTVTFRKWTTWQDYHITVQFLGDVEAERISDIQARMNEAGTNCSPFELRLGGWGIFGRSDLPRVLWRDVEGEKESLLGVADIVARHLALEGYERELRPYSPHITVARQFRGHEPFILPFQHNDEKLTNWSVDRLVLYRTHMHERPMYEAIHVAKMRNVKS
ncbi:RNA 2',3'-cyclic phosphodiesterase [Paenibacillus sp. SC116]|uniref:RNA 2',3'-cyclic phosphodiesterase n=1 Tax=Paenibacillus sp. SC116 TaxID=2968986 RepID=UPI00215B6CB0|nr:RNA 2',3'-cyclic phosphodiesterase [Paenibacillus sp. SC116]MCR8846317.1 RNA 2',3'-cyclic phosphodiesterase [Paenibacillus sp. SC116]